MKRIRRTKIICTIGPSTNSEKMIKKLVRAGMNVARLNCSHGTTEERRKQIDMLKRVREKMNVPLAIMLDTKGPEYRLKQFKDGQIELKDGDRFVLTTKDIIGDQKRVSVTYKKLHEELKAKDVVLANDGLVKLKVVKIEGQDIICKVLIGGVLSNNKSLNFPKNTFKQEYLSDADKKDLLLCVEKDVDYVACSFVSNAQDVMEVRNFLDEHDGQDVYILSKIENQSGIDNLKEICKYSSGIMVARGDLGVEIDFDKLPVVQKYMIKKCRELGKIAITCTEMLESMIENSRPTRAEVSDIANAVFDGASALMLSGETAAGKHPIKAVKVMSDVCKTTEKIAYNHPFIKDPQYEPSRAVDAIAHATCAMTYDVGAKAILNFTESGYTAKLISNFRPNVSIVALPHNPKEYYKLAICWGVIPLPNPKAEDLEDLTDSTIELTKDILNLKKSEKFVVCYGWYTDNYGYANSLKVLEA